ncbi:MAG: tetratricopeptide repeat protein [Desulfobacterales bacterium]
MNTSNKADIPITSSPKYEVLQLALLAIVVILIYADTLTTPFILDDIHNIRDNSHIRITSLSLNNILRAGLQSPAASRPIANISFALNYYFSGLNLVGFHLINILIHILAGIFLYFFVKTTLTSPVLRARFEKCGWIPFFTAFIWLVHPLQTQSVAYLVQRMNSLAAMFYILSMLFYVKYRLATSTQGKPSLLAGCILAGLLALGTKPIAATLPLFIILYDWYFFQDLSFQWGKKHFLILGGILLLVISVSLIYLGDDPIVRILSDYRHRDFTLFQRVLTQFRVVIFYISLLLWPQPSRLNLDHDFVLSHSLTDPVTTLISMVTITALIVLSILTAKREPILSYAILWYFGNLVIESSVIGLELVFEHRNYLPSMFVILAMVTLVFRYVKPIWTGVVFLCVVGTLFTVWTFERNKVWADELLLYQDCVRKSPAKARPRNNLGAILLHRGRLQEAVEEFQTALDLKPDYVDAHYNLGIAMVKQGNLADGIRHFSKTLNLKPRNVKALNNMAATLALKERYPEAIDYLKRALLINPEEDDLHSNLGIIMKKQGNLDGARHHFNRALQINPGNRSAFHHLEELEKRMPKAVGD